MYVYVMVQFYPWFKSYFPLFQTHIIHYNTQKHKKRKFEPRIKLNHNICIQYMIVYYVMKKRKTVSMFT